MSVAVTVKPVVARLGLVSVDYDADAKDLIRNCRLDTVQPEILDHLPQFEVGKRGVQKVEIFSVHFNRLIGLLEAVRELSRLELWGIDFRELLAVGAPDGGFSCLQCQFPLLAIGAGCRNKEGDCGVPYLWYNHQLGNRTLLLNWAAGYHDRMAREFRPFCRFLAVPKPQANQSAG